MQPVQYSELDRIGEGNANAFLLLVARQLEGARPRVFHLGKRDGDSGEKTSCMRVEERWEKGSGAMFEGDGVGKPGDDALRHMLPHCSWELRGKITRPY